MLLPGLCAQDFDAETVSKLMYGLIALGYEDEALLALLVGRAKELAQLLGPEDVTRMMWAVGELGYFDDHFLDGGCPFAVYHVQFFAYLHC